MSLCRCVSKAVIFLFLYGFEGVNDCGSCIKRGSEYNVRNMCSYLMVCKLHIETTVVEDLSLLVITL
jgi:hypothetical protein